MSIRPAYRWVAIAATVGVLATCTATTANAATNPAPKPPASTVQKPPANTAPKPPADAPKPSYAFNGQNNNAGNPNWGAVKSVFLRQSPVAYADGKASPSGASRPSARAVSNSLDAQTGDVSSARNLSDMVYVFGQFLSHDLALTTQTTGESFPVAVPTGDPYFDPASTGTKTISLTRSTFAAPSTTSAVRQQNNWVSGFLDGSVIYGSSKDRADALRTMAGGQLKTSTGNMLPLNTMGLDNANDAHMVADTALFAAGDIRANENPSLTSMQTVFVREHNRIAAALAATNPRLNDEQLYQQARRTVTAELQWVTYNEFLPALLGSNVVKPYTGYNPSVNPSISTEFTTAAFRFGHSQLDGTVNRLNNDGTPVPAGPVSLMNSFFNPTVFDTTLANHAGDIDPYLKGSATGVSQEIDLLVVDDVRNFLFGPPGAGGFDLAALNIQRGRDHGIADYNTVRAAYGLPKVTSFAQITANTDVAAKLKATYGTVDNIDLWVGGLAEDHVAGGSLGPVFTRIVADQFTRLRVGDRLYFETSMSPQDVAAVKATTLSQIIMRNTALTTLQPNVFFAAQ